jgi:toxin HigB-1
MAAPPLAVGLLSSQRRNADMLDAVVRLEELRSPPSNQLEALKGDHRGQFSIRINR